MPSKFNEQIKDEKQKSKFEKTREILYGNRYNNSNFLEKGWYNVRSYFKLKTVEVGEYIRNGNAKVREGAHKFKNSNLYFKAEQASDKVASGAKKAMKVSKRGAKAAAEIAGLAINKVVDKAKEFSEKEGVKKTTSMLKNAAVAAGKRMKTAGIWTKNAAVTAGSFIKKAAIATAKATVAGARAAKNSKYGLKASEAVAYCQRGIKKGATSFKNSKFASGITSIAKKVKSGIAFAGSKTMKGLKAAARKTAEVYGGLKSKWIDYRYEKKYMNSIKKNEIHGMLRDRSGGELYKYNINKFRKDVLASKEVEKNLKLRSNRERIRRNVDAMEKGHTGDVELVEMSSEGTFIKDDPGEGMLQSVNKYDLGNALITEASSKKKKVNLDEVVKDDKAEDYLNGQGIDTKNIPKTVPLDNKNIGKSVAEVSKLQKSAEEIKGKSNEAAKKLKKSPKAAGVVKTATDYAKDAETTLALGKISLPVTNFGKAIGNALNIQNEKEREKNIAALITNCLDEAGKIIKKYGGDNSFSKIAATLNAGVEGMDLTDKKNDKVKEAGKYVKNIQAAGNFLNATLTAASKKNVLVDQISLLKPVFTIIDGVDKFNALTRKNEKINALTDEDKGLNLTDKNVIRHLTLTAKDLVNQNKDKQVEVTIDTVQNTALGTAGIFAGGAKAAVNFTSTVLKHVSPTSLIINELKSKTDHELMMEDVFGSMEKYREHKDKYNLTRKDIEREILNMTNTGTVQEYASRVRAETALHLHSRINQANKYGIESGATKLKDAAELNGKSAKEIYKEIGGRNDFDKVVGRSKQDVHKKKIEEFKKKRAEDSKKKLEEKVKKGNDLKKPGKK